MVLLLWDVGALKEVKSECYAQFSNCGQKAKGKKYWSRGSQSVKCSSQYRCQLHCAGQVCCCHGKHNRNRQSIQNEINSLLVQLGFHCWKALYTSSCLLSKIRPQRQAISPQSDFSEFKARLYLASMCGMGRNSTLGHILLGREANNSWEACWSHPRIVWFAVIITCRCNEVLYLHVGTVQMCSTICIDMIWLYTNCCQIFLHCTGCRTCRITVHNCIDRIYQNKNL